MTTILELNARAHLHRTLTVFDGYGERTSTTLTLGNSPLQEIGNMNPLPQQGFGIITSEIIVDAPGQVNPHGSFPATNDPYHEHIVVFGGIHLTREQALKYAHLHSADLVRNKILGALKEHSGSQNFIVQHGGHKDWTRILIFPVTPKISMEGKLIHANQIEDLDRVALMDYKVLDGEYFEQNNFVVFPNPVTGTVQVKTERVQVRHRDDYQQPRVTFSGFETLELRNSYSKVFSVLGNRNVETRYQVVVSAPETGFGWLNKNDPTILNFRGKKLPNHLTNSEELFGNPSGTQSIPQNTYISISDLNTLWHIQFTDGKDEYALYYRNEALVIVKICPI